MPGIWPWARRSSAAALLGLALWAGPAGAAVTERVVAIVDRDVVTLTELMGYRTLLAPSLEPKAALMQLVEDTLFAQEAARFDLQVSDQEIAAAMKVALARAGGDDALARLGYSHATLRQRVVARLQAQRLVEMWLKGGVHVAESEIVAYHQAHRQRFPGSLAQERDAVERVLREQELATRLATFRAEVRARHTLQIRLENG